MKRIRPGELVWYHIAVSADSKIAHLQSNYQKPISEFRIGAYLPKAEQGTCKASIEEKLIQSLVSLLCPNPGDKLGGLLCCKGVHFDLDK